MFFEVNVEVLELQMGVVGTIEPEVVSNLNVIMKRHARMGLRLTLTISCLNVNLITDCIVLWRVEKKKVSRFMRRERCERV